MSETKPDIPVDNTAWVDLNTASGVVVGTKIRITNKSDAWCRIYEGVVAPAVSSKAGSIITNLNKPNAFADIPAGSLKIWALSTQSGDSISLNIQEI